MARKRPAPLGSGEIEARLRDCPGWKLDGEKIRRDMEFQDFSAAFAFMTRVAMIAESLDHHPEWSNVYNRLTIELTTHDAGGISELDFEFATQLNALID